MFFIIIFHPIPGSQHSGTGEEYYSVSNDIENLKQEDRDQDTDNEDRDEDAIDCKCIVCERQCQDIDQ